MGITAQQVAAAETQQQVAAQDALDQVRLVAGPGTGKSSTIEERVRWLLAGGAPADSITAISFTRASAFDLRGRIAGYCLANGQPDGADVPVTTMHSLALRLLRRAGALGAYPVDPNVMDEWELDNIFDPEFGSNAGVGSIPRRRDIRRDHEAFWSTGSHSPPHLIPPDPPITASERTRFREFHRPRTQLYSCVLPGEIIRKCVELIEAGTLQPAELVGFGHVIVDEFQDLNPMDLQFVDALANDGATIFVAGDDDQSLYSFRFASPSGIQRFTEHYPGSGDHSLEACFRCTPVILSAATSVIQANAAPTRIPKHLVSLYKDSAPAVAGSLGCARYQNGRAEAAAVAQSCSRLLAAGMDPRRILILLSNQRAQGRDLFEALDHEGVPFEPPREASFRDEDPGRLVLAATRIVCDGEDYVAHRTVLGLLQRVGVGTCDAIAIAAISGGSNYRDLFYNALPDGVFGRREVTALTRAQGACAEIVSWGTADTLEDRREDICELIRTVLGDDDVSAWNEYCDRLPGGMTLEELRTFLQLDKDEQQADFLRDVCRRLDVEMPDEAFPPKVRIMSMHGAKGLSAQIVFIPGLEEEILPGPRRQPYPGLVLEAARMLYVSITRARLACILSYARRRFINGSNRAQTASRFTTDVGHPFTDQAGGITDEVARALVFEAENL